MATPARHTAVPTEPTRSRILRPIRSITDMASMVNTRFVAPTATACRSHEPWRKPACPKLSLRQQDTEDHVELEKAYQTAPPFSRCNLRDVHRTEHRGAAYPQPADEAKKHQCDPTPGKRAPQRGNQIQHRHSPQTVAPAIAVAR